MTRVFERDSFLASLTEAEREMRPGPGLIAWICHNCLHAVRTYYGPFYEWLLDNQLTPHLVVDVTMPGVRVPMEYARDGQIVLNIAPRAVGNSMTKCASALASVVYLASLCAAGRRTGDLCP